MSKKHMFEVTAIQNNTTFYCFAEWLYRLAVSRFKWLNTPKTWDLEFLEDVLYYEGMLACVNDENYGLILARCVSHGKLNYYDLPTSIQLCGANLPPNLRRNYMVYSPQNALQNDDIHKTAVIIKNNRNMQPTNLFLNSLFTPRLYETQRAIDVNTKQQKTPGILVGTEKQRLTLLNLYKQYDGNETFIFADKELLANGDLLRYIGTQAPYLIDKLMLAKKDIWNEALTFLGINNVNYEKKERLITEEANANNHVIELNAIPEIKARKKACEEINALFGTNIDVEMTETKESIKKEKPEKEGFNNE